MIGQAVVQARRAAARDGDEGRAIASSPCERTGSQFENRSYKAPPGFRSGLARLRSGGAVALSVGVALCAGLAHAAESILLNESAAQQCYLAALNGSDARDIDSCNVALEHQALKESDFAATLSNRGLLLSRSDRHEDALADHDRAISMAPATASLYVNRANTYTRARRYDDAMRDLDRAIELAGKARAAAEQAAAAEPPVDGAAPFVAGGRELAAAHYNRALLFQRQGNFAAALADARRASEYMPDRPGYRAYVDELERLSASSERTPGG